MPTMRGKLLQGLGILWMAAILTACATSADQREAEDVGAQTPQFSQIKAAPESFKGQTLVLGGQVLSARRLKEGTRIEVLQLPLNEAQQPSLDLTKSQGRFVAIQREFLDPATVPQGTFLTITGQLTGSVTQPLDETDYTYPVLEINSFRTWIPSQDSTLPRYRPYPYYSPFWNPYWGPYGRFPYYW
ncbi:MAG: Slp family lipoprotein [Nitrospira sp. CR1.1]|nr:Slp family lipoprotein [Nitrospira sp. CR1.1]